MRFCAVLQTIFEIILHNFVHMRIFSGMHKLAHDGNQLFSCREVADELFLSVSQVSRYASRLGVRKMPGRTGTYLLTSADIKKIDSMRRGKKPAKTSVKTKTGSADGAELGFLARRAK